MENNNEPVGGTSLAARKKMKEQQRMMSQQPQSQQIQQPDNDQSHQMPQPQPEVPLKTPQPHMKKPGFKSIFMENTPYKLKLSVLVALLFLLLNSKMVWKNLMKIKYMGSTEPSMLALVTNSILCGIIFYIITKFLLTK
jgi:hypothetical protein